MDCDRVHRLSISGAAVNLSHPDFYSKRTLEAPKVWAKCIRRSVTIVFDVKFIMDMYHIHLVVPSISEKRHAFP